MDIKVKTVKSEEKAISSGADNIVDIGKGLEDTDGNSLAGASLRDKNENFDRMVMDAEGLDSDTFGYFTNNFMSTAAHEFAAHLLDGDQSSNPESLFYHSTSGAAYKPHDHAQKFSTIDGVRGVIWSDQTDQIRNDYNYFHGVYMICKDSGFNLIVKFKNAENYKMAEKIFYSIQFNDRQICGYIEPGDLARYGQ